MVRLDLAADEGFGDPSGTSGLSKRPPLRGRGCFWCWSGGSYVAPRLDAAARRGFHTPPRRSKDDFLGATASNAERALPSN
jgi:hypothetical protein